jgi:hypothetical protein
MQCAITNSEDGGGMGGMGGGGPGGIGNPMDFAKSQVCVHTL